MVQPSYTIGCAVLSIGCLLGAALALGAEPAAGGAGGGKADEMVDHRKLKPVPFTAVKLTDGFWAPRIETNRTVAIPHNFKMCETTGRIDNFAKAGGLMKGEFRGIYYDDSDLYKAIEGACYSLATHPDPELDKYLDGVIAKIAAAQRPDGYLFTFYTLKGLEKRWANFKDMHELYCAGHFIEAAVAHRQATGKNSMMEIAVKLADHIDSVIGPQAGKKKEICGHEEIELALVKLAHATGQKKYLDLAKFMIDTRGTDAGGARKKFGPYHQDHVPLAEQDKPVGHAVRAMYFYSGAADVAAATGDPAYLAPLDRLWASTCERKMYITGGVGARHAGEAFGDDYELPNESAYCETCAAIGNALWNYRMGLLHGDGKYFDVVERIIYNGFLSGVSLSGDRFFYVNPLASKGRHHRKEWYGTACCPSNVVRFLPSIPGYVYATDEKGIYVNLYVASTATFDFKGSKVTIVQKTEYPWDGKVELTLSADKPVVVTLNLRTPGWTAPAVGQDPSETASRIQSPPSVSTVGAEPAKVDFIPWVVSGSGLPGEYRQVTTSCTPKPQTWIVTHPMPVKRVYAHAQVKDDAGRVALQRGPVVYCLEAVDQPGKKTFNLSLPKTAELKTEFRKDLLGGVTVITGTAVAHARKTGAEGEAKADPNLVRPAEAAKGEVVSKEVAFTAVPYYAWDHREAGEMQVWVAEDPAAAAPTPPPTLAGSATASASHCWQADTVDALHDGIEPRSSDDHGIPRFTWWPRKGSGEWVQYEFAKPTRVSGVDVYFFQDKAGCRLPESWKVQYKSGDGWKDVEGVSAYPAKADGYSTVSFTPVTTPVLRLTVKLREGFSGGILEWRARGE